MSTMPTYDHVPTLKELLPSTSGVPGCEYALVTLTNLGRAQKEGWLKISGKQLIFEISGPSGVVECELYARGKPIKGQGIHSGARQLYVDETVYQVTGHGGLTLAPAAPTAPESVPVAVAPQAPPKPTPVEAPKAAPKPTPATPAAKFDQDLQKVQS